MARYMNEYSEYKEAHTALDDSRIEFQLARMFVAKHFKEFKTEFLNNVQGVSWTEVRKRLSSAEKMRKRAENPNFQKQELKDFPIVAEIVDEQQKLDL